MRHAKLKHSDETITVMLKNKLAEMIEKAKDPATVVAVTGAYAKLRGIELKADEGEWGQELPAPEAAPNDFGLLPTKSIRQ